MENSAYISLAKISPMATPSCKACWEMQSLFWVAMNPVEIITMDEKQWLLGGK